MTYSQIANPPDHSDAMLTLLDSALVDMGDGIGAARSALEASSDALRERFLAGEPVGKLVSLRAFAVDKVLMAQWRRAAPELLDFCDKMRLLLLNEIFDKYDATADILVSANFDEFAHSISSQ